jgi:hypothetical protein
MVVSGRCEYEIVGENTTDKSDIRSKTTRLSFAIIDLEGIAGEQDPRTTVADMNVLGSQQVGINLGPYTNMAGAA